MVIVCLYLCLSVPLFFFFFLSLFLCVISLCLSYTYTQFRSSLYINRFLSVFISPINFNQVARLREEEKGFKVSAYWRLADRTTTLLTTRQKYSDVTTIYDFARRIFLMILRIIAEIKFFLYFCLSSFSLFYEIWRLQKHIFKK